MKKLIVIDDLTAKKSMYIASSEDSSIKCVEKEAIHYYVKQKETEHFENLTDEEK